MLVSLTGRTGEIGMRTAIGARPSTVRPQFLSESIVLPLYGGIRALEVEINESWIEATRYLNMVLLSKQKKEQLQQIRTAV